MGQRRGIFLSYRREDAAGYAGRLHETLVRRFGTDGVFLDIDSIEPGADFVDAIHETLTRCSVVLALIGPRWLDVTSPGGERRLDNPTDFVRVELETALSRKMRVIPVVVQGARMPDEAQLPSALCGLGRRQSFELSDRLWSESVTRLMAVLDEALQSRPTRDTAAVEPAPHLRLAPLGALESLPFVGRWHELERLRACSRESAAGQRRVLLVSGEPGIGKTRLVAELAREARDEGSIVLVGRCNEEVAAPCRPFVEALRGVIRASATHDLRAWVGHGGYVLNRLVPELGERLPDLIDARNVDPDTERLLLFEAVDAILTGITQAAPVIVVLDDLHWADKTTLLLVRHLARSNEPARLLLVGTYRDAELTPSHPLTETLADLRRGRVAVRVALDGLDDTETAALIAARTGDDPAPTFAATLRAATDGNPFFVEELLIYLEESEAVSGESFTIEGLGVPAGVREMVARRVGRLSRSTQQVLALASLVGREFDFELVLDASDATTDELVNALDEATAARLVGETTEAAGYAFSHALVQATLANDLTSARRAQLHRKIAHALEIRYVDKEDRSLLPALAYHFGEAASIGEVTKAAVYGLAASRRSLRQAAFDDGVAGLERSLAILERSGSPDRALRCDVLLALAEARYLAGDIAGYRDAAGAAIDDARALRSAERLAAAAVLHGWWQFAGIAEPAVIEVCEEALALLDGEQVSLRAQVLSTLADQRGLQGDFDANLELGDQALELARAAGDDRALLTCLASRMAALRGSGRTDEQLALGEEAVALWERTRDILVFVNGAIDTAVVRLELGDKVGFDAERQQAERLGHEWHSLLALATSAGYVALLALLEGRFDEVEPLSEQMVGLAHHDVNFLNNYAAQLFQLRREQGRMGEVKSLMSEAVEQNPTVPAFRAALALAHVDLGELDDARSQFDRLATEKFRAVPRDLTWTVSLAILSEVCTVIGDPTRARVLQDLLSHHTHHLVVSGNGVVCLGAVDRYLGMLATVQGNWSQAYDLFEAAVALEAGVGAVPLLARTRYWFASMLLARHEPGDSHRAADLLTACITDANGLGMALLADQGDRLRASK